MGFVRSVAGVALAVVMAATSASAADRNRKKAPEPPPAFHLTNPSRILGYARTNITVPQGMQIGTYNFGLICGGAGQAAAYSQNAFGGVESSTYGGLFLQEATAAGYRTAGDQGSLFETQSTKEPDLLIGAVIQSIKVSGCGLFAADQITSSDATVTVEWQVFDPLDKKLLYKSVQEGKSKASGPLKFVTLELARLAFQDSAKKVVSDPAFVEATRDTSGRTEQQTSNALFPEATSAAPPPTSLRIASIPLKTETFQAVLPELQAQVVTVRAAMGVGSGFQIADGLWLTNHHVAGGAREVRLRFNGGREIKAYVVTSNASRDVALLRSESIGMTGLSLRTTGLAVADKVYVIGSPRGEKQEGSVSFGVVSAFREVKGLPMIQSDAQTTHGNSGGPMFDEHGNVVGITVSGYDGTQINYYIPIGDALRKLDIEVEPPLVAAAPAAKKASTKP